MAPVKILVVEDEPAVRDLAVQVLTECGYEVLAASDGPEALEIGHQHEGTIDLLLTDVVMPHMNGKELAAQLRSQWPGIRVLYMSGYTDQVIARQDIKAEDVALLSVPHPSSAGGLSSSAEDSVPQPASEEVLPLSSPQPMSACFSC